MLWVTLGFSQYQCGMSVMTIPHNSGELQICTKRNTSKCYFVGHFTYQSSSQWHIAFNKVKLLYVLFTWVFFCSSVRYYNVEMRFVTQFKIGLTVKNPIILCRLYVFHNWVLSGCVIIPMSSCPICLEIDGESSILFPQQYKVIIPSFKRCSRDTIKYYFL
jgi:hypothetical protein